MTNADILPISTRLHQQADSRARHWRLGAGPRHREQRRGSGGRSAPIVDGLDRLSIRVPRHQRLNYNGHILLKKYPECARALAKYRINPGNCSIGKKDDDNFRTMIEVAIENDKPVRIGVSWGSLDQAL